MADSTTDNAAAFLVRREDPDRDIRWILTMVASVVIPAALTLATIRHRPDPSHPGEERTPYGYTVSLLLFVFPVLLLHYWRRRNPDPHPHHRAFYWSSGAIAVVGFVLDLFFGRLFFTFRNPGATIGVRLPAWTWETMSWGPPYLPIEEFGFYVFGSLFVIALYMWADADWLRDYAVDEYQDAARTRGPMLRIHWPSLAWWGGLAVAGLLYKRYVAHSEFLPGYFLFIMVIGFLPNVLFLHTVSPFVNWRAFGFAYVNLTLISLLWEATLGVPYNWWNYQHDRMLGIHIPAWSSLPLEAVLLWLVVAWDCVIAYELFRVFFHMDKSDQQAMIGIPDAIPKPV